ncbi:MAG: type II CRISPR-associated endonuclease Cas1 [Caenispirillum sp.]|nr:type II CRISPR-associated endonuclease Cas1 [Caenispirillum sp.]
MWRVVDIAGEDRHLRLERQALVVRNDGGELGRIPLTDLNAVVVHAVRCTVTTDLAAALAAESIPLVLCDSRHMPVSITWPATGHFEQADRVETQALRTDRVRKRLWAQLVRAKVREQAATLDASDGNGAHALRQLAKQVRSGDPGNIEARAAAIYWPRLFGADFRRDHAMPGINAALNYGYTILRSSVARSVAATGLTPALGLFHKNRRNPFRLVDDLMEPFRPLVDRQVKAREKDWADALGAEARASLAALLTETVSTADGDRPLYRVLAQTCHSLVEVLQDERQDLDLPTAIRLSRQSDLLAEDVE